MGKYRNISKDGWSVAQLALLRYHENIKECAGLKSDYADAAYHSRAAIIGDEKENSRDVTSAAAINIFTSKRIQRLEAEIKAVDDALMLIKPEQREIIKRRFFGHEPGERKKNGYDFMQDLPFCIREMQNVTAFVIYRVAYNLGEK